MILFIHLKIILLQCFLVFSFQLYPNRPLVEIKKFVESTIIYYALFVSALTFSGKLLIFQRAFSRKLSQFPVFGNDFENELENVF